MTSQDDPGRLAVVGLAGAASHNGTMAAPPIWPRRYNSRHTNRTIMLFLLPAVIYLLCLSIFPLLYSLYLAFQEFHPTTNSYSFIGFRNFSDLFQDQDFFTSWWN